MDESFAASQLPAVPEIEQIERWAIEIRKVWYASNESD